MSQIYISRKAWNFINHKYCIAFYFLEVFELPEDGSSKFLKNDSNYLTINTVSYSITLVSSVTPLWKPSAGSVTAQTVCCRHCITEVQVWIMSVHVGFVVDEVGKGPVFLQVPQFSPVTITPTMFQPPPLWSFYQCSILPLLSFHQCSIFPSSYHSTNFPYSFIHLTLILYILYDWKHH